MATTRDAVAQHIRSAFDGGGAARPDLLEIAKAGGAPADVLETLATLPQRRYSRLLEVWEDLPQLAA